MLTARGLGFSYAERAVLHDVSFDIASGGLVGILGPNGCGKTTLLKLLAGTLRPRAGHVTIDGRVVTEIPRHELSRAFAVVPQETHLAFDYTVLEIALMGRYPHLGALEVEGPADVACALNALEATGTRPMADRSFETLSGGEKQRVVIASALAQLDDASTGATKQRAPRLGNRVLLLDEPTASLDLRYQIEIAALLKRLHAEHDITIVLSTHDLHFASSVCEEVILLGEGQILASGSPGDVLTLPMLERLYGIDVSSVFSGRSGPTGPSGQARPS